MWTSDRRRFPRKETAAEWGAVTLGGNPAGVYLDGERRRLPVYGPGGYCWRPALGDQVLVLKAGDGGENPCLAGQRQREDLNLQAGEVSIFNGGGTAGVRLKNNGKLELSGSVLVNGQTLENVIRQTVAKALAGQ